MEKRVTSIKALRDALSGLRTEELEVEAYWEGGRPVLTMEQVAVILGAVDSSDVIQDLVNTSGEVTEASAAAILADTANMDTNMGYVRNVLLTGNPLMNDAAGVQSSPMLGGDHLNWIPIVPVTVTADGAGNPPVTEIVAAVTGKQLDVMLWMTVDTVAGANQYQLDLRQATGAPAVVSPDYTAVELPLPANGTFPVDPYGMRAMTTADAVNFGIADGANGDWPNGAKAIFSGFYREI